MRAVSVTLALLLAEPCDAFNGLGIRASAQKLVARAKGLAMAEAYPRVVVTGMGLVSCIGNTLDEVADSLYNAKSGLSFSQDFVDAGMKSQVSGAPTDFDAESLIGRKQIRFMGQNAKYAYVSMLRAIEDSGLKEEEYQSNPRTAGILGQADTSAEDLGEVFKAVEGGKRVQSKIGPYRVTRTMGSSVSAVLATQFKLQGVSYSISSACSTGAHCIGQGMEQIQLGKQDICFCGAGESGSWRTAVMFDAMSALSTKYNDDPKTASRAFDTDRDGFVIGAGGGVVVVEELEHAKARGAKIYGELVGYGATADGYDMVAPSGVGGQRAMEMAMNMADELGGKKQVDYVNTHGTSTPVGDLAELKAIKDRFIEAGYTPFVGSTKSLTGHAVGAAGVHEAIYSLLMLNKGFLAQSVNINNLVPEAEGMKILTERHDGEVERVMSNSFGFGGTNCCLVFDKYTE